MIAMADQLGRNVSARIRKSPRSFSTEAGITGGGGVGAALYGGRVGH